MDHSPAEIVSVVVWSAANAFDADSDQTLSYYRSVISISYSDRMMNFERCPEDGKWME
jgi:hypothetical protein